MAACMLLEEAAQHEDEWPLHGAAASRVDQIPMPKLPLAQARRRAIRRYALEGGWSASFRGSARRPTSAAPPSSGHTAGGGAHVEGDFAPGLRASPVWRDELGDRRSDIVGMIHCKMRLERDGVATRLDEACANTREIAGGNVRVETVAHNQHLLTGSSVPLSAQHADGVFQHVLGARIPALSADQDPLGIKGVEQLAEHGDTATERDARTERDAARSHT